MQNSSHAVGMKRGRAHHACARKRYPLYVCARTENAAQRHSLGLSSAVIVSVVQLDSGSAVWVGWGRLGAGSAVWVQ